MRATTWNDIPDELVRPGVRRRAFGTDACMLVMNECTPGMQLSPHEHDFDQLALIIEGHGLYHVADIAYEIGPGSVLLIPKHTPHYIEPIDETIQNLDVFAPAREDYLHLLTWMQDALPHFKA